MQEFITTLFNGLSLSSIILLTSLRTLPSRSD